MRLSVPILEPITSSFLFARHSLGTPANVPVDADHLYDAVERARISRMWEGTVVSIHIAREAAATMESITEVRAVPGRGLVGDRYFAGTGYYSKRSSHGGREATLIEIETIERLGIKLAAADTRRNIATSGVPLNHLVDCEFCVGTVLMRGTRLCEPCKYLEELTQHGVMSGLIHRGGLRAQILSEGVIHVGDAVRLKTLSSASTQL